MKASWAHVAAGIIGTSLGAAVANNFDHFFPGTPASACSPQVIEMLVSDPRFLDGYDRGVFRLELAESAPCVFAGLINQN